MFLKTREIPLVKFRADLPAILEPVGAAYIEVDARPAWTVNQAYMAALDKCLTAKTIRDKRAAKIEDDIDRAMAEAENLAQYEQEWFGAVYDTCVIAWRTNLINAATDAVIECNRETFIDLLKVPVAEVRAAFGQLQADLVKAGQDLAEADAATAKN